MAKEPVYLTIGDLREARERLVQLIGADAFDEWSDDMVGAAAYVLELASRGGATWHDIATTDPPAYGDVVWLATSTEFTEPEAAAVVIARRIQQGGHDEWRGLHDDLYENSAVVAWAPVLWPAVPTREVSWR